MAITSTCGTFKLLGPRRRPTYTGQPSFRTVPNDLSLRKIKNRCITIAYTDSLTRLVRSHGSAEEQDRRTHFIRRQSRTFLGRRLSLAPLIYRYPGEEALVRSLRLVNQRRRRASMLQASQSQLISSLDHTPLILFCSLRTLLIPTVKAICNSLF